MELKFKKLNENAVIPSYAHEGDAGLDLVTVGFTQEFDRSGKMVLVYHTGLAVEIPEGYVGLIFCRSSIAERSLTMTNCVGIIDHGYSGELIVKFKINTDALPTIYKEGEKIAQLIVMPYPKMDPVEVEHIVEGERGVEGFGSTDSLEANKENENAESGRESGTVEGDDKQLQA